MPFGNTYIDTLPLAQALYLGLRNYKLDTIGKYLEIPPFQHHRACDDAKALAQIYVKMNRGSCSARRNGAGECEHRSWRHA